LRLETRAARRLPVPGAAPPRWRVRSSPRAPLPGMGVPAAGSRAGEAGRPRPPPGGQERSAATARRPARAPPLSRPAPAYPGRRPVVKATGPTVAADMAQNLYGPGVRMGNWNEDVYLEEELLRDFLGRREKGQLLVQRSRRLKETLLRQTQLSVSEDGYIHFGHQVMVVSPDFPEPADLFLAGDLSLCLTPDEIKAHLADELEVLCGLSAARAPVPVGRNTFVVLSVDGSDVDGQVLRFGQSFCLGTRGGMASKLLFLSSDHRTLLRPSPRPWLQEVFLAAEPSPLSCWQAAWPDPQLRLEQEGAPVPAGARLLLRHRHSGRALAVHRHLLLRTYFGREAEVAAHTHLDARRVEKPQNHWLLVTGSPRPDGATLRDLPPPPLPAPAPTPGPCDPSAAPRGASPGPGAA
ncbi:Cilia- and flagella-associated protein 161, partial [Galemys pyrenaicus]